MDKYYLIHGVVNNNPDKIMKILIDGYLYASKYTNH